MNRKDWPAVSRRWPDGTPRLPTSRCPHCNKKLDAASVLEEGPPPAPAAGDLTLCFGCGEVLTFDRRLRPQKITAAELAALPPEAAAELHKTQQAVRAFLAGQDSETPR